LEAKQELHLGGDATGELLVVWLAVEVALGGWRRPKQWPEQPLHVTGTSSK